MAPEQSIDEQRADLIDKVHHEHAHLRRLFDDLASSFRDIAAGEIGDGSQREVVSAAAEDLEVALEDMLHHFNQEEEVFFVELEERFPELESRIQKLVDAHELMAQRTRWLYEQLDRDAEELSRDLEVVVDVLDSMADLVETHTEQETELFDDVLQQVPAEERRELLEKMQQV